VKSKKTQQKKPFELLKRAEKKLKSKTTAPKAMSDKETRQLHEMQVHQIELEMQNEELRRAQAELEETRPKYSDLYDFAPVGYFTFDKRGLILEANLTAAKEIGVERSLLIHRPFRTYIIAAYREIFDSHLQKTVKSNKQQTCEIKLKRQDGSEFYVQLCSIAANDVNGNALCRATVVDIDRQKNAEEHLKKSEKRFRRLVEFAPDPIFVQSQGLFLYLNHAMLNLLGASTPDDLIGKEFMKQVAPEYHEAIRGRIKAQHDSGKTSPLMEQEYIRLDGSRVPVETTAGAIRFQNRDAHLVFIRDITERKQAEKSLREEEEKYRILFHGIVDAVYVHEVYPDKPGKFLAVNETACRMLGYTEDEFLQMEVQDIDTPQQAKNISAIQEKLFRDRHALFETYHIAKDGRRIPVEINIRLFEVRGKSTVLSVARDITERKAMEERLWETYRLAEDAIDALQAHICVLDETGTILTVNRSWRLFAEANPPIPPGYCIGTNYLEVCDSAHGPNSAEASPFAAGLRAVLHGNKEGFILEYPCNVPDGEKRWFIARITIFRGDVPKRVVVSHENITERKQMQEELQKNEAQLSDAVEIAKLGYWEYDAIDCLFTFNDQFYSVYRTSADKVGGYTMSPARYAELFLHPDDRHIIASEMKKAFETADPHFNRELEHRILYADGEPGYVSVHYFVVKDDKGRTIKTYGANQDITERKLAEEKLRETKNKIRKKLDSVLDPEGDIGELELQDIIDVKQIQSLMDDFYKLTNIGIGILDLRGNVLVSTGWQDVCTKFHRVHPEACKHCLESDMHVYRGTKPGEFNVYKCKNNMWDIATPITVANRHMGNLFLGQFFFENEHIDYEVFRAQAAQYGFDEQEYLKALEKVPRWSHDTVETVMQFYIKFAHLISVLSYSNIKLARLLEEQKNAAMSQRRRAIFLKTLIETIPFPLFYKDVEGRYRGCNSEFEKFVGKSRDQVEGKTVFEVYDREPKEIPQKYFEMDRQLFEHPGVQHYEGKMMNASGELRNIIFNKATIIGEDGSVNGLVGIMMDITEKKKSDERIEQYHQRLGELASQLALAAENERHRFADELHDITGQNLALAKIKLSELKDLTDEDDMEQRKDRFDYVLQLIDEAARSTRSLTFELSPPILYELGFEATAEWLGEQILKRYNIACHFEDDRQHKPLTDDIKVLLYLSLREVIVNIAKHSKASNATLSVRREGDTISVSVSDDGVGFDASATDYQIMKAASFGLFSTRERLERMGGQLKITSQPGQGTTVTMIAPLNE
jgi:PAS domain S-box-containing protein